MTDRKNLERELSEILEHVAAAGELLEDMVKIGIIYKGWDEFYYYRWRYDYRDDEWYQTKEIIATVRRDEDRNIVGITWSPGIHSPGKLLKKLVEKYRSKTQEVASLHETVRDLSKPKEKKPEPLKSIDEVIVSEEGDE